MTIKAILWDVDGTIVLSEHLHMISVSEAGKDFGGALTPEDELPLAGKCHDDTWAYLRDRQGGDFIDLSTWKKNVAIAFKKMIHEIDIRDGVLNHITLFQNWGLKQAAVSNGEKWAVEASLEQFNLYQTLEFSLSIDDVAQGKGKPAPDIYLKAAERLNLLPHECLVIEDSPTGCIAGHRAGMVVVARPTDRRHDFSMADYVVDNLEELDWKKILDLGRDHKAVM